MSVKNAAKILAGRFGIVWGIMLFVVIYLVVLISLSLVFVLPIIRALENAGLFVKINELFDLMLNSAITIKSISSQFSEIWHTIVDVFSGDAGVKVNFILLITLVLTLINRFMMGFYELAACESLHDKMSYNLKRGFFGRFFANLKRSAVFSAQKMVFAILVDAVIIFVIYGIFKLWGVNSLLNFFLPFLAMLAFILLEAIRYSLTACWTPAITVDGEKVFDGFKKSVKMCFKHFGRVFSSFIVCWTLIVALNFLFAIFTFGAALLLTVPLSMAFICSLNMTNYYANTGRRYYINDENIQQ